MESDAMIGRVGRVTGQIAPGRLGEVMVPVRGGSEAFYAYAADSGQTIARGSRVVVVDSSRCRGRAERAEQRLQAGVRKPADVRAYEQVTLARAEREARGHAAEARAREIELQAAADANRVKLGSEAMAPQTRPVGEAEGATTGPGPRARPSALAARPRPRRSRPGRRPWPTTRRRSSGSSWPRSGRRWCRRRPSRSATSTS